MIRRTLDTIIRIATKRSVTLTIGVVLLSLCVLLIADTTNLRDNGLEVRQESREALAETLAIHLSSIATRANGETVAASIERFVQNKHSIISAELTAERGELRVRFGAEADVANAFGSTFGESITHVTVPILANGKPWGMLQVGFRNANTTSQSLLYFGFVALGLLLTNLTYLSKVLVQLDPSKAVPERVHTAFDMLAEGVIVLDTKLRIIMANEAACTIAGRPIDELIGRTLESWPWVKSEDWQAPWTTVLNTGLAVSEQAVTIGGNRHGTFSMNCSLIRNQEEELGGLMITLVDITAIERKNSELSGALQQLRRSQESITQKNRELEVLASQDPLTGLNNRRALVAELERQAELASSTNLPLSCIMLDIDHFKRVNDTLGHAVGDEVICAVANQLTMHCRQDDTAGRVGGEEFVMVLPETDLAQAAEIAERIRRAVERIAEDVTIAVDTLSTSLGVAALDDSVECIEQLLDHADQALYYAKNHGRNQVALFKHDLEQRTGPSEDMSQTGENASIPLTEAANEAASESVTSSIREIRLSQLLDSRLQDLNHLKTFDSLTGIPKRDIFVAQLERYIATAARTDRKLGLLSMSLRDVDKLSSMLGHEATQTLIKEFTLRIRDALRRSDLVSEVVSEHNLSHIGATEFGILLGDLEESQQSLAVVTRIRRVLSKPFLIQNHRIHAGVNIGVALYPEDGTLAEQLLQQASRACTAAARHSEKIAFCFANDSIDALSQTALEMESDLYEAVENSQFTMNYQPKFDLSEQRVSGVEALIRWQHPDKGWISPAEFIPLAEANGLIKDISTFVIQTALEQVKRWHDSGLDPISVSVNISGAQLRDPNLVSDILTAIKRAELAPEYLDVEITETSVIESPQRARIALGQLRAAGITVSMDDFGIGYTSLALLADLPLDSVKIDRSFVEAMANNERSRAIVESIINMAHTLKLSVVGEGIETNEQLTTLAELGCNIIQGYLISKPLDSDQATHFLQQQARHNPRRKSA